MKKGVEKEAVKANKVKPSRGFLWWGLRASFLGMIGTTVLLFFAFSDYLRYAYIAMTLSIAAPIFSIFCLTFSTLNLVERRSRWFSIIATISSVVIIFFLSILVTAMLFAVG